MRYGVSRAHAFFSHLHKSQLLVLDVTHLVRFFEQEIMLASGVVLEILDYAGDAIVFRDVMQSKQPATEHFVPAFIVCFSVASLVSFISLLAKGKLFRKQLQKRKQEASALWVTLLCNMSQRQRKVIDLHGKLEDCKKVRRPPCPVCSVL